MFLFMWPVNVSVLISTGGLWDCIVNFLFLSGGLCSVFHACPMGIFSNSNEAYRTKELLLKTVSNEKELS